MQQFDLKSVPQEQLVAFYGLTFAAASVDGSFDREEMMSIFELIDMEPLDQCNKEIVRGYLIKPPVAKECLIKLHSGSDELKFAVVVGIVEVIFADDVFAPEEELFLTEICNDLGVNDEQKNAIINFVTEARRVVKGGFDESMAKKIMESAASGLTSVGVPIAAVYFSGSVIGLSAAGITSGLAALGLGLGMVPGIGIAVVIGASIFFGMKTLLGKSKTDKEKAYRLNQERRAQMVIKNLQEAINAIIERISTLEASARKADENEAAINYMRERLLKLQKVLAQRSSQRILT